MPSIARKHQLQGSLIYHIINRGNRRDDIFHYKEDYQYFIKLLSYYSTKFKAYIYHWVIMPNHYHILIEIQDPAGLSKMMAGLGRSYVYYYQKQYKLGGHIWQGRFKSQPIEKEKYLLSCARYIERNPVKAKIVEIAEEYKYSSAGYYVYDKTDGITNPDPSFESFGNDITERRLNYSNFLKIYDEKEGETLFKGDIDTPIGDIDFKSKLVYSQGRYLPRRKGRPRECVIFAS